ncbi:MAG: chain-length determining protein [Caulobacterales bacterium]|nr:chain-length determining protein [Caulobacterales bacterium]
MSMQGQAGGYGSGRARLTWSSRPRYGWDDLVTLLWRERLLMLLVFVVLFLIGGIVAMTIPKTYTAHASLLAQLSQDYVYEPRAGDAARGAIAEVTNVAQSEAAILSSAGLHQRVVEEVGAEAILGPSAHGTSEQQHAAALVALGRSLEVETAPDTGVIQLSYKGHSGVEAARILNQIISTYQTYRLEVFRDTTTPLLAEQRDAIERQQDDTDRAYEQFLNENDIGDFAIEREALRSSYQTTYSELLSVEAQLRQADGRLAALRAEMAGIPPQITLQEDLNFSVQSQIVELRADREELLGRYQPDAPPVRDIDAQLAQLEALALSGQAGGVRDQRLGPNPVWQDLEMDRVRAQAERDSLAARRAVLARQVAASEDRQAQLVALESRNGALTAEREVLSTAYRDFTARQVQSSASAELARGGADNVRIIAAANPPDRASSLRKPILILAFLFAGFAALCAGLMRVFLGRRFVTAGSASRTLDLPVLAVTPSKGR